MASRQNLLQFAVCVITSKITELIIMFYCVIVRFKQNKFISSKINDNAKQIDVSRLVSMLSVCVSTTILALQSTKWLMSDTNSFSATRA